ncbi:MAG: serine/threonine protein kinase [Candidatus Hydrogenedentes bacterium]|nr:serine/threonine protein kinase [Candidatus Hydrogenedentota bacterium]
MIHSSGDNPTRSDAPPAITDGAGKTATGGAAPLGEVHASVLFRPGQVVAGRFKVVRLIGHGGMGAVYAAQDAIARQAVAMKVILPALLTSQRIRRRFIEEVNTARAIRHPGVVTVYDLVEHEHGLLYTMELLRGHTLRAYMTAHGKLPLATCAAILGPVCDALEYAHTFTIHRDISPENIMLLENRDVKLLDFGIAKPAGESEGLGTTGAMGKDYYMAPEQRRDAGTVDARADLWSVGVTLFEMLTGEMPMGYGSIRELRPDLPKTCDELLQHTIAPVEARYPSAKVLGENLAACAAGKRLLPGDGTAVPKKSRGGAGPWALLSHPLMVGGITVVVLLAAGAVVAPLLAKLDAGGAGGAVAESAPAPAAERVAIRPVKPQGKPFDCSGYWQGGSYAEVRLELDGNTCSGWLRPAFDPGRRYVFHDVAVRVNGEGRTVVTLVERKDEFRLRIIIPVRDGLDAATIQFVFDPRTRTGAVVACDYQEPTLCDESTIQLVRERGDEEYFPVSSLTVLDVQGGEVGPGTLTSCAEGAYITYELRVAKPGTRSVGVIAGTRGAPFCMYIDGRPVGGVLEPKTFLEGVDRTSYEGEVSLVVPVGRYSFGSGPHQVTFQVVLNDRYEDDLTLHDIVVY